MADYEGQLYCDIDSVALGAKAGKDILLCIFDSTGESLIAVAGQQSLTISRSADTIDVSTKDTVGGNKSAITGMKEWSIDVGGVEATSSEASIILNKAFDDSAPVCLNVYDKKQRKGLYGGLAYITTYDLEAGNEDALTYSLSLKGTGALVNLSALNVVGQVPLSLLINDAMEAVVLAEVGKTTILKEAAQTLVTALPAGTIKTELQARVTAITVA